MPILKDHTKKSGNLSYAPRMLSIIWKSDIPAKIKLDFFQAVTMPILPCGCTRWILTKRLEKKVKWMQHKNAMCCFEHIMKAAHH